MPKPPRGKGKGRKKLAGIGRPKQLALPFGKPAPEERLLAELRKGREPWIGYLTTGRRVERLVKGAAEKLKQGKKVQLSAYERAALATLVELRATKTPSFDTRPATARTADYMLYQKYLKRFLPEGASKK